MAPKAKIYDISVCSESSPREFARASVAESFKKPPEEVRKLVEIAQSRGLRIPDITALNSMLLALFDEKWFPGRDFAEAVDMDSLFRLAALHGGEKLQVPTIDELYEGVSNVIFQFLIMTRSVPIRQAYSLYRKICTSRNIVPKELPYWRSALRSFFRRVSCSERLFISSEEKLSIKAHLESYLSGLNKRLLSIDQTMTEVAARGNKLADLQKIRNTVSQEASDVQSLLEEVLKAISEMAKIQAGARENVESQ